MAIITDGVRTKFTDDTGLPLIGGQVFSYVVGTSTPKDTYQDRAFTIPNTNPIILDDVGSCEMYLNGGYRLRVLTAEGVLVEEKDNAFQSDGQVLDVVANTTAIAALRTNIDVLNTRGGLKTDANNHVIGQGKAESATVYDISFRSDKVHVSAPTDLEFGDLVFKTYDAPTVVNGVIVPKGTWLNPALVTPLLGTAATKNVGSSAGDVMGVGAYGLGATSASTVSDVTNIPDIPFGFYDRGESPLIVLGNRYATGGKVWLEFGRIRSTITDINVYAFFGNWAGHNINSPTKQSDLYTAKLLSTANTTRDPNGFVKRASPVVDLYCDKIELNQNARSQPVTFEKLGIGNYLIKNSLGFAQEGWYIEMPKDANGNVLVAVKYEQLDNNDISVKTYAKKFDMETGDVVANLDKPLDIPDGRFIAIRLYEALDQDSAPVNDH